jgi:hypothetical protein
MGDDWGNDVVELQRDSMVSFILVLDEEAKGDGPNPA